MWTRKELKTRAKQNLKRIYWSAVGACLILMILQALAGTGNTGSSASGSTYSTDSAWTESYDSSGVTNYMMDYAANGVGLGVLSSVITTQFVFFSILLMILRLVLNFVIVNPVLVGHASFFYKNRYQKTGVGELAFAFNREDLFPVVKTMFLKDLYVTLWSLLFIIPGIVKNYAYRMVPYILSEYPQMSSKEALRLSNEMTKGHKMNMFILDLSFFGWALLGSLTLGVFNILFTTPYMYATEAELYGVLKQPFIMQSSQADVF